MAAGTQGLRTLHHGMEGHSGFFSFSLGCSLCFCFARCGIFSFVFRRYFLSFRSSFIALGGVRLVSPSLFCLTLGAGRRLLGLGLGAGCALLLAGGLG